MTVPEPKVLIVDDEETIRALLRKSLQKAGYSIAEAADAVEALEKLKTFNPHVVLLDIVMPGIAGNDLLETIKELKPATQIIMVTALDREAVKNESFFKGAFDFIAKPIDRDYLLSAVKRALAYRKNQPR